MKKLKKIFIYLIILLTITLLNGCWDYHDLDKRTVIIAVGVDKVNDQIEYTIEIAQFHTQEGKTGNEMSTPNVFVDQAYGENFEDARNAFNSRRSYPSFLGATRVVVLGSEFAKESIEPYINRINKVYDYRKTLLAVVSKDPPGQLIKTKVNDNISVGFFIEDSIYYLANTGATVYSKIGDIVSEIALRDVGYVLPYVGVEKGSIQYLGLAIMKDSRLTGIIEAKDSKGFLYIKADNILFSETLSNYQKGNTQSFRVKLKGRNFETKYVDGQVIIEINLQINAQLQYQYFRKQISKKDIKKMEEQLADKIEDDLEEIIEMSQQKYKTDFFQFARVFHADHPEIYTQINWPDAYLDAKFVHNVEVKIINLNLSDPFHDYNPRKE